jgi:hypothetical protein
MRLQDFISAFDKKGVVVLLEGKRQVLEYDKEKLIALGRLLASKTHFIQFRSGNAQGSDEFFSKGVASVHPERLEVITPYSGHRAKQNLAYKTYALDEINLVNEPDLLYNTLKETKNKSTVKAFVEGSRNQFAMKAAYLIRDTAKVIGTAEISHATFAIFYDDLINPEQGGTGHTIRVCKSNNIPFVDQGVWFDWL